VSDLCHDTPVPEKYLSVDDRACPETDTHIHNDEIGRDRTYTSGHLFQSCETTTVVLHEYGNANDVCRAFRYALTSESAKLEPSCPYTSDGINHSWKRESARKYTVSYARVVRDLAAPSADLINEYTHFLTGTGPFRVALLFCTKYLLSAVENNAPGAVDANGDTKRMEKTR
jgi:hypothetical protein